MNLSATGNASMTMSIASLATLLKSTEVMNDAQVAVLSEALDLQEEITADLFQALEMGQNIDIVV